MSSHRNLKRKSVKADTCTLLQYFHFSYISNFYLGGKYFAFTHFNHLITLVTRYFVDCATSESKQGILNIFYWQSFKGSGSKLEMMPLSLQKYISMS